MNDDRYAQDVDRGIIKSAAICLAITAVVGDQEITGQADFTYTSINGKLPDFSRRPLSFFENQCEMDRIEWYGPAGGELDLSTLTGYLVDGADLTVLEALVQEFNFDVDWEEV